MREIYPDETLTLTLSDALFTSITQAHSIGDRRIGHSIVPRGRKSTESYPLADFLLSMYLTSFRQECVSRSATGIGPS